jgi:hypothetical protein
MSAGTSPELQGAGMATMTPRGFVPEGSGLQVDDMEKRLSRYSRKPTGAPQGMPPIQGSHTARTLLEENLRLSAMKNEVKKDERRHSKELVDEMLQRDQQNLESDRKKEQKRRDTQKALAQKYRTAILQKELAESQEYQKKQAEGTNEVFFPFTEGETVEQYRQAQSKMLKSELQAHLKEQSERQPVRQDSLMASVSQHHQQFYGSDNKKGSQNVVPPYMGAKAPHFLSRGREHVSRRINDGHVSEAMDCKVEMIKTQLEQLAVDRHREARQHEEGLMINDALRYDNALQMAAERQKNAQYLKEQIAEREKRANMERKQQRGESCGYFGPEEKNLQNPDAHEDHCRYLISQMGTDQLRRIDEKHSRLQQEKQIVQNTMAVMAVDRQKAAAKTVRQKQVLVTTWNNQKKIRAAKDSVERIGD